ncbi:MAG: hypothetical protein WKF40_04910 [Thermoleophilaceae bacterium]
MEDGGYRWEEVWDARDGPGRRRACARRSAWGRSRARGAGGRLGRFDRETADDPSEELPAEPDVPDAPSAPDDDPQT